MTRVNGHYQTALQWREDDVQLPTSGSNWLFQNSLASCLSAIRDSYDPSQWRYVNSERNPADVASWAETSLHCHKAEMWLSGPEFLWKHSRYWPEMPGNMSSVAHDDPEIKRNSATIAVVKEENCFLHEPITYFCSWIKLLKAIAWWLRFKTFCRAKFLHQAGNCQDLTRKGFIACEEIDQASTEVVKLVQKEAFEDIRRKLKNHDAFPNISRCGSSLGKTSPSSLRKLRSIMVCDVLRVGGRLQHADLPAEEKHPVILPSRHHMTNLIV